MHDGDVCNLGSINLEKFVTSGRDIDIEELKRVTKLAVRMLDNVIDISDFPVERVSKTALNNRRIGLGIMGFADMLYLLRIPYNSEEGRKVAKIVMSTIQETSHEMSVELGKSKGVFNNWDKSIFKKNNIQRRNSALTNIAPTGAIAMMFNVSGGVEPYYALAYHYKNVLGGDVQLQYFNKHLESVLKEYDCYTKEIMERIEKEGTLRGIKEIPESIRNVFVTSMDISAKDHILMQAVMQENCDNAISKTINFSNSATRKDILEGYILAWEKKCKGCTVYRDGSRFEQVLNINKDKKQLSISSSPTHQVKPKVTDDSDKASPSRLKKNIIKINDKKKTNTKSRMGFCPDCLDKLIWQEGCCLCNSCGYSACSKN